MSPAKTFRNVPDLEGKNSPQPNSKFNLERNAAGDSALCATAGSENVCVVRGYPVTRCWPGGWSAPKPLHLLKVKAATEVTEAD